MNYQDILGSCHDTTVSQVVSRCPSTLDIFRKYMPDIDKHSQTTIEAVATTADEPAKQLCRELFDTLMAETPIDDLDTDVLLEMVINRYEARHLEQLPKLHRLARKIETVHRTNPEVPKGITLAIKDLEHRLTDHIERENLYVLNRMEHDQPPDPHTPIAQMNEEHADIKDLLKGLRQMTGSYRAPDSACRSWQRLYQDLKALDFSLREQIFLERDVLFPRFQF